MSAAPGRSQTSAHRSPPGEGTPASADAPRAGAPVAPARVHLPSLAVALAIMVVGSVVPLVFADAQGKADHGLALALFWAMSAGMVRGVGFVPHWPVWRWLFSGWAVAVALGLAAWIRWGG